MYDVFALKAYRAKYPGNLMISFSLHVDGGFIPCTDKLCLFSVVELNNRTNWNVVS